MIKRSYKLRLAGYQGYDLETLYKSKFPFLNSYNREDKLKLDVIDKIINDLPLFTPKTLFETIQKIKYNVKRLCSNRRISQ